MHPPSLLTWLGVRDLCLDTGQRFNIRLQLYNSNFLALLLGMLALIAAVFLKIVEHTIMNPYQWVSFGFLTCYMSYSVLNIAVPTAYMNEQTNS